jgi:hypothetical protein
MSGRVPRGSGGYRGRVRRRQTNDRGTGRRLRRAATAASSGEGVR